MFIEKKATPYMVEEQGQVPLSKLQSLKDDSKQSGTGY